MPKLSGKASGDEEAPQTVEVNDGHNGAVTIRRTRGKAQAAGDGEAAQADEQATRKGRAQMSIPELLTDATKRVRGASLKLSAKTVSQETVLGCASDLFKAARQLWAVGKAE